MALSDEEQRLLAQMEAALAEDDPKLAHTLSGSPAMVIVNKRRAVIAVAGLALGLILLPVGIIVHWSISLLGFVVMLASVVFGFTAWQKLEHSKPEKPATPHAFMGNNRANFMNKMEEQWRKRMENGGRDS